MNRQHIHKNRQISLASARCRLSHLVRVCMLGSSYERGHKAWRQAGFGIINHFHSSCWPESSSGACPPDLPGSIVSMLSSPRRPTSSLPMQSDGWIYSANGKTPHIQATESTLIVDLRDYALKQCSLNTSSPCSCSPTSGLCILLCPLLGRLDGLCLVLLPRLRDIVGERVVRVRGTKQSLDGEENGTDLEGRRPVA
jgi:hypothetical protein